MTQHGPDQPNPARGGLPNDLSQGWLPEDKRQTPTSPLPAPKFWGFQSLLPYKAVNGLRHPGELPWLIAAYSFTLISYIGLIVFIIESFLLVIDSRDSLGDFGDYPRTGSAEYYMQEYLQQFVVLLVLGPLLIYIARAILYAQQRVRGIRMSPTQFPEGYQMVVEAARAAGLRRVPDAYVISGNGTLNAFAAGHGFRRYICVYSDMFEVGGKTRDPEALRYVIGHEVGHIAAGHVSYFRLLFTNSFMRLPVVGQALSRAQEYTADNFGYRLSPDGARGGMKVLAGGKYLNKQVNFDEFADRAVTDGGLAVWFVNLISSHPVLTWRAHAIRNRQEPGRLFWRPTYNPPSVPALIPSSEPVPLWPDPLQADAFMQEQKPAWENYSLDTVQLHTTTKGSDGGTKMEQVHEFTIEPGATLELKPGGDHIMLMDMSCSLAAGGATTVTVKTEDGASLEFKPVARDYQGAKEEYKGEGSASATADASASGHDHSHEGHDHEHGGSSASGSASADEHADHDHGEGSHEHSHGAAGASESPLPECK